MEQEALQTLEQPGALPRWAAVAAATLELGAATVAHTYSVAGICPTSGGGSACTALIRPRLAALGPVSVSQLAVVGATFAVGLAMLLALGKASRGLSRSGVATLAAGVGFALGIQLLPWRVSGAFCPLCLGVVVTACLAAALVSNVAVRAFKIRWREPVLVCVVALAITAPFAFLRAESLRSEDVARLAALEKAGGASGPRLILVTRPGCPYCDAFRVDALGDPQVLAALERTRGLLEVRQGSAEALPHGAVKGVPTLLAVGPDGRRLGEIEGHRPPSFVIAWLAEVAP